MPPLVRREWFRLRIGGRGNVPMRFAYCGSRSGGRSRPIWPLFLWLDRRARLFGLSGSRRRGGPWPVWRDPSCSCRVLRHFDLRGLRRDRRRGKTRPCGQLRSSRLFYRHPSQHLRSDRRKFFASGSSRPVVAKGAETGVGRAEKMNMMAQSQHRFLLGVLGRFHLTVIGTEYNPGL